MSESVIYVEDRAPNLVGAHGRAWKVDIAAVAERHPGGPPPDLTPAWWIVEARWAHPIWHSYMLTCVSLRMVPNWQPAKIWLPGATHEVLLYALNPEHKRALNDVTPYLLPGNFHGQWIAGDDAAASAFIEETVKLVIDGKLNPDTDARSQWIKRFSASNMKIPTELADVTTIIADKDGVTVFGTGRAAVDAITTIAAGPIPPENERH